MAEETPVALQVEIIHILRSRLGRKVRQGALRLVRAMALAPPPILQFFVAIAC